MKNIQNFPISSTLLEIYNKMDNIAIQITKIIQQDEPNCPLPYRIQGDIKITMPKNKNAQKKIQNLVKNIKE